MPNAPTPSSPKYSMKIRFPTNISMANVPSASKAEKPMRHWRPILRTVRRKYFAFRSTGYKRSRSAKRHR